jgi:ATP phosphoribosyltransferase regulatory subunit
MTTKQHWILPEGIEEVLPEQAARFEAIRRLLLDLYAGWGYELVIPPTIDFIESLLTGTGHDLDLQTFKLVDQLSGRTLGIRADMTPQVARIDAHQLQRDVPTRLCYIGTVLHTRPESIGDSRSPLQVGAELYGHAGVESEVEIIGLMLQTGFR